MSERRPKAADLDDRTVLLAVERLCIERDCWALGWDVDEAFPTFPQKVVAAKLSKLLKRGLLTGCDCGCRGDWELTSKGRALAGIETAWRENPGERYEFQRAENLPSEAPARPSP